MNARVMHNILHSRDGVIDSNLPACNGLRLHGRHALAHEVEERELARIDAVRVHKSTREIASKDGT
jgi:hypothetical protein